MGKILLTGAAGFIGSHLSEKLVDYGFDVIGVDRFSDFYSRKLKRMNVQPLLSKVGFKLIEKDILEVKKIDKDTEYIFHTAAQPGVRTSWGKEFEIYVKDNILVTQHLLELSKGLKELKKFVFSSSSSVYGDSVEIPTTEECLPKPESPYGVTKLAAEQLCNLYHNNYGIPVIALRYFTVFGPRQRPDMAFHKFIKAILLDGEIVVYGDGDQSRDFTYVSDIVNANLLAAFSDYKSEIFNIGGGNHATINEVLEKLKVLLKKELQIKYVKEVKGDVKKTEADIQKAESMINFSSHVSLDEGLKKEVSWLERVYR